MAQQRIEYIKTIIHGDHDLVQERLLGALRNVLWARRYFTGPVDIFKQHNRDIYYVLGGPTDLREKWTDPHLDDDERKMLVIVPIDDILNRLDIIPDWYSAIPDLYTR